MVTSTLGAPASALGLIEGISDGLGGVTRLGGGALSDDPSRRRRVAVGGYASTAVLASLTGGAVAVWQVGILRAGAWASRGLRVPARNALLADMVPAEWYGRAYGFERAMDNLGAIGGPLLAIALVAGVGVRAAIGLSVIPGLLAALAIVFAIRHAPALVPRERQPIRLRLRPVLGGRLGRLLGGVSAFELGNVAATLLILRATQLLQAQHSHARATELALGLYTLYNAAAAVASIPGGRLGDRIGATRVLAIGVSVFGLAYVGYAVGGHTVLALAPAFVAAGVAIGLVETAEHAAVAALSPPELRGSAFGALAAVQAFVQPCCQRRRRCDLDRCVPRRCLCLSHGLDADRPHRAACKWGLRTSSTGDPTKMRRPNDGQLATSREELGEKWPLTCGYVVGARGFQPRTSSV